MEKKLYFFSLAFVSNFIGVTCYPPHWQEAPDSLEWYIKDNVTLVNPWNYIHRLGLYKIMLKETEGCMTAYGFGQENNPLWGLPIQHGWQFDTHRLKNFGSYITDNCDLSDDMCISYKSWWADMNYHLSVVPFLGMVNAGYFNSSYERLLLEPPLGYLNTTLFCDSVSSCLKHATPSLSAWTMAFAEMKNCSSEKRPTRSDDPQWRPDAVDKLMHLVWNAHVHSLEVGVPLFEEEIKLMSQPEQNFGNGWASIVDFIAATRFLTSREETHKFQEQLLPKRLLQPGDEPPNIPDMTPAENQGLWVMNILRYLNGKTDGRLLALWRRAMCSKDGRNYGRYILTNVATNPWGALKAVVKLIYHLIFTPCDPDWV